MTDQPVLADFSDLSRAITAVQNPATPPQDLIAIAYAQPVLGASVARHPRAIPELLDWLDQFGNDQARAAVAEQRTTAPPAVAPAAAPPVVPAAAPPATRPAGPAPTADQGLVPAGPVGPPVMAAPRQAGRTLGGGPAVVAGIFFLVGALLAVGVVVVGLLNPNHWGDCINPGASLVVTDGSFIDSCYGPSASAQWGWLPMSWSAGWRVAQLLVVGLNTPLGNVILPGLGAILLAVCGVLALVGRTKSVGWLRFRVGGWLLGANALLVLLVLVDVPSVVAAWLYSQGLDSGAVVYSTVSIGLTLAGRALWIVVAIWLMRLGLAGPESRGRGGAGFITLAVIAFVLPAVQFLLAALYAVQWSLPDVTAALPSALLNLVVASIGQAVFLPALLILALIRQRRDYSAA